MVLGHILNKSHETRAGTTKILVITFPASEKNLEMADSNPSRGLYRQFPALSQLTLHNDRPTDLGPNEARTIQLQQSAICIYEGQEASSGQNRQLGARPTHLCLPPIPDESDRVLPNKVTKGIYIIQSPIESIWY